jgi:hypothetical protein
MRQILIAAMVVGALLFLSLLGWWFYSPEDLRPPTYLGGTPVPAAPALRPEPTR